MIIKVGALDPAKRKGGMGIIKGPHEYECYGFDKLTPKQVSMLIKEKMSEVDVWYLEAVHSMPQQGVKSMFTFGTAFGHLQGILQSLSVRYELAKPTVWQKQLGIPKSTDKKRTLKETAQRLFPLNDTVHEIGVTKAEAEGAIDAILIAEYGYRMENKVCLKCKEER